jgi:type VI secretion system secreted protein VgrG
MNLDIETTVRVIFVLLLLAAAVMFANAVRLFREAGRLNFFLKKRELLGRAWKTVFYSLAILGFSFFINNFAEPATYRVFSPSPTPSQMPSATLSPTASLAFTATNQPTETVTPEFTSTPMMPAVISEEFTSEVTPNPDAVFSQLVFAREINNSYEPIDPTDTFANPLDRIFGTFSYDRMTLRAQWTSLWFRDGELVYYETIPWNGASGGFGFTDCQLPADQWLPGNYEVQMFVGDTWKISGTFNITGEAPTPTPTETLVPTATIEVQIPTATNTPASTASPTATLPPPATPTLTSTPTPRPTGVPTITSIPTATIVPTATRRSTIFR